MFPTLETHGLSLERLAEGLPVSVEHLRDPSKRIDWDTNLEIVERALDLLGPEKFSDVGERSLDAAPLLLFRLLGVFVADTRYLYRMACRWIGPSFFAHIRFDCVDLPDGRVRIEIEIPASYRGSVPFFRAYEAGFRAVPRVLGHGNASVEAEISPHLARFYIRAPRRASLLGWIRRLVRLPQAARAAVEEVASHQTRLNRALEEVRGEHAELRSQVEQIATLDRLGNALARQLGSEELPDRILDFLTQRFGWLGASLFMRGGEDRGLIFFGRSGQTEGEASSSHPLVAGGRTLGRLEVWSESGSKSEGDAELLERLLPWIAMTVTNARFAAGVGPTDAPTGLRWASQSGRDLFMVLDQNARILYAGPRADELLGYGAEDLMQMDPTDLVHPDDWPQLAEDFSALARHTSSAIYSSARVQSSDGDFRRMEGVAIKVLSETGAGVYLVSCGEVGEQSARH